MVDEVFNCQKCNAELSIHDSLERLSSGQLNLLTNKYAEDGRTSVNESIVDPMDFIPRDRLDLYNEIQKSNPQPIISKRDSEKEGGQNQSSVNSTLSYVMVSEDSPNKNNQEDNTKGLLNDLLNTISGRINTLNNVFSILSNNQDIDHPLCADCSNLVVENFKLKFDQSQREKDYYLTFLRKLKDRENNLLKSIENEELDSKLLNSIAEYKNLQQEESSKISELKELVEAKNDLGQQLNNLNNELKNLNQNELNGILQSKNSLNLELKRKVDKLEQSKALYQAHLNNLDNLRTLNIYNKFFNISFVNEYGTINGFRIGYKIPWSEINSALGQIVLLLVFIIKRLDVELINYKLIPMGSKSQIVKVTYSYNQGDNTDPNPSDADALNEAGTLSNQTQQQKLLKSKTILNLYSSNEFSLGKLFNFNKLDVSMIALLDILYQIGKKLSTINQEIELPYGISKRRDSIGGKSIRVTSNGEWTHSCKFLLTNLNWILAYASAHPSQSST